MQKYFSDKQQKQREAKNEEKRIRKDQKNEMNKYVNDLHRFRQLIELQKSLTPICFYCERKFANFEHLAIHEEKSELHLKNKLEGRFFKKRINDKVLKNLEKEKSGEEISESLKNKEEEGENLDKEKIEGEGKNMGIKENADKEEKKSNMFKIELSFK